MRKFITPLLASLLFGALLTWITAWAPFSRPDDPEEKYYLEVQLAATGNGMFSMSVDHGTGNNPDRWRTETHAGARFAWVRLFAMPPGQAWGLRIWSLGVKDFVLGQARIRSEKGKILSTFDFHNATGLQNLEILETNGDTTTFHTRDTRDSTFFLLLLPQTLYIPTGYEPSAALIAIQMVVLSGIYLLVRTWIATKTSSPGFQRLGALWASATGALRARPVLAIVAVSVFSVVLNCFPLVFCGRSLVSPNIRQSMLYENDLVLPGEPAEPPEDTKGTDVGAMVHQHYGYGTIEHDFVFNQHAAPLWNRYSAGGVSLLGQGQAMLGDPLQWLLVTFGAKSWAWDLKFVLARILFSSMLGLCVWALVADLPVSLLVAASAVWIGYFAYRYNHPAIFSVCYAPTVLFAWLRIARSRTWRQAGLWSVVLCFSDILTYTSGTAKEATILMLFMNIAGGLAVLFATEDWRARRMKLGAGAWATVLFLFAAAPFWLVFVDELRRSASVYEDVIARQIPLPMLLGVFDEMFGQGFSVSEYHVNPSSNLLMFMGVLWLLATLRRARITSNGLSVGLTLGAFLPFLLTFGIIPPWVIKPLPLLGNIGHIFNTFGCVLIVLAPALAGIGLHLAAAPRHPAAWRRAWRQSLLGLAISVAAYISYTETITVTLLQAPTVSLHKASEFFACYGPCAVIAAALAPLALRLIRGGGLGALDGAVCLAVILFTVQFRNGMYLETKFDPYVMNPRHRMDLAVHSPAIEDARARAGAEPCRMAGLNESLNPGFMENVALESIAGSDALFNRYYRDLYMTAGVYMVDHLWQITPSVDTFPRFKPLYDFLNVRYYLSTKGVAKKIPEGLTPVAVDDMEIYRSDAAWPRAFFTNETGSYNTTPQFVDLVLKGDGRPFAAIQVDNAAEPKAASAERVVAPARDYQLTPNDTAFTIDAPSAGTVVLGENFESDNFQLTVNDRPASYFRVNHTFKGLNVPAAGTYRIKFHYWPKVLTPALWMGAIGLALVIVTLVKIRPSAPQRAAEAPSPAQPKGDELEAAASVS